jgi:transcriptional regulator with XRE-family HTH domain
MSRPLPPEITFRRFGQKLRTLRTAHGLTLKELAQSLGYSRHGYISELETGEKIPTAELVLKTARIFGITTDALLNDELDLTHHRGIVLDGIPFVDRPPTFSEIERIRLILSTYQDGTGMNEGGRKPGWRDFERSVATALGGDAPESKFIFDVLLFDPEKPGIKYGLSCKMGNQLDRIDRQGRAFMELSNSYKKFWDHLNSKGITHDNFKNEAAQAGIALVELVKNWHVQESLAYGGNIDIQRSSYLVLSYNAEGWYQLHQFPLEFPNPAQLDWRFPTRQQHGQTITGNLRAYDREGMVFEWYGESGGQLTYYPPISQATWASQRFQLEPLPDRIEDGLIAKVKLYFPNQWDRTYRGE